MFTQIMNCVPLEIETGNAFQSGLVVSRMQLTS